MTASLLPAASEEISAPKDSPPVFRGGVWLVAGLTVAWVLFLAVITWRTANPPVVNVVQIENSDLILVGRWADREEDRFEVSRELKRGELQGIVTVTGVPKDVMPAAETWVIPVQKFGGSYAVTQGQFVNPPWRPHPEAKAPEWQVRVNPQCYPATDDVLAQIEAVLKATRPTPHP